MLARKGLVIVLLISLIAGYFYFRPYFSRHKEEANITDRLPAGNFIGKVKLLDLAREASAFLYYNKLPFRDFLTYEFILAQSKNYGLNVQKPIYFFSNPDGEWGSLISVTDSSKILSGIARLKQSLRIEDTLVGGQKVVKIVNEKIYMTYGKTWLMIYHGNQLPKRMYHVIYSKKGEMNPLWKEFLNEKKIKNETLIVFSKWSKFKKYGIEKAIFTQKCDSIYFSVKSYFKGSQIFDFSLKKEGIALPNTIQNDKSATFHLDVSGIRKNPKSPLKMLLNDLSKRINFPIEEFFNAWEGDITFQEGGRQTIKESYIETEFDEEFNPIEVKKEKEVSIPAYVVLLSMNQNQKSFISTLFAKGIMRKENDRYYVLTSPPLKINVKPDYLMLYSSTHAPKRVSNSINGGFWKDSYTHYHFQIDSLNQQELFFSFQIPGVGLLRKNKILH